MGTTGESGYGREACEVRPQPVGAVIGNALGLPEAPA